MKNEIVSEYVMHNGTKIPAASFDLNLTSIYPGVYEVIRIIEGVPLFFEKHMARFRSSAKILGYDLNITDSKLQSEIRKLSKMSDIPYGNIKIIANNLGHDEQDVYMYFMVSKYPTEKEIEKGVPLILYRSERNNPSAKSTDLSFRKGINEKIQECGAYEALLLNSRDEITEGSKSNVFFEKGGKLYTPPLGSVLAGVTRSCVLEICSSLSIPVVEAQVSKNFLNEIDGLFITGTSPQVLPVSSVDGREYKSSSDEYITKIRKSYEKLVHDYISSNK